jgi:hypothetical protein
MYRLFAALTAAVLLPACPADELVCVEHVPDCTPQYEPTFDNVFTMTLEEKCAVSNACHAGAAPKRGLDLSEIDRAYEGLTAGDTPLVVPGDAECSVLIERVGSTSSELQMPPGGSSARLPPAELCALQQWVAAGALRE